MILKLCGVGIAIQTENSVVIAVVTEKDFLRELGHRQTQCFALADVTCRGLLVDEFRSLFKLEAYQGGQWGRHIQQALIPNR